MSEQPLVWNSISEGDEITALRKQPSYMQLFMFSAATWNRHLIHYNTEFAHGDGLADVAPHRALIGSFLAQMLSNWAGDAGRVSRLEWSVRGSALPGKDLTCKGTVVSKRFEGDKRLVECSVWAEDEEGVSLAPGKAVVTFFE